MRNYSNFDLFLNQLQEDVYPAPPDEAHSYWAKNSLKLLPMDIKCVLDVGCGTGFMKDLFDDEEILYTGITLGEYDLNIAREHKRTNILHSDMSFTGFPDNNFDLIYARHSLEHSPFPILTLMEWYRIATKYLLLIMPAPEYWGYYGRNHYSVMNEDQLWGCLDRARCRIITREYLRTDDSEFLHVYRSEEKDRSSVDFPGPPKLVEYRYLCKKQ